MPPRPYEWPEVDGVRDVGEYRGAVSFPYVNTEFTASGGRVFATILDDGDPNAPQWLRLFLEDIPVSLNPTELVVYIDHDRFEGGGIVGAEDAAYAIDLDTGLSQFRETFGGATWVDSESPYPWFAEMGVCDPGVRLPVRLCDVELAVQVPYAFWPPDPPEAGEDPGIGIAVVEELGRGAFPEAVAEPYDPYTDETYDVTTYQTLLFGDPEGVPFSFVSWNVRRFTDFMRSLTLGDPFESVLLQEIAVYLHGYDIIAVQELWSLAEAEQLLALMNDLRDGAGLPPLEMHGSVQFAPNLLDTILEAADELHGGLFIFSRFPAQDGGYEVFDQCRGEDCVKAKGVQWVRLSLNPPGEEHELADCIENIPGSSCPEPPSGEMFLDVFNTHMQADAPLACADPEVLYLLGTVNYGPLFAPMYEAEFWCLTTDDQSVRQSQMTQMDTFIDAVMGDAPNHQALIAGDFNVDGQFLNRENPTNEYGRMLDALGLLAPSADPGVDEPNDVYAGTTAADFSWDIDHADVAREMISDWTSPDRGTGTFVDRELPATFWYVTGTLHERDFLSDSVGWPSYDGMARFDYILVRPGDADTRVDHVIGRTSPVVWESPWPEVRTGSYWSYALPPTRLSDHKPVIVNAQLVSLRHPPPYHPFVSHDYGFTVTSVDATGESDCFLGGCNPLDLFTDIVATHADAYYTWSHVSGSPKRTSECAGWVLSTERNPCMWSWYVEEVQDPVLHHHHRSAVLLGEDDDGSGIDWYTTLDNPVDHPRIEIDWLSAWVRAEGFYSHVEVEQNNWTHFALQNNDPIRWCTRDRPIRLCVEITLDELAP